MLERSRRSACHRKAQAGGGRGWLVSGLVELALDREMDGDGYLERTYRVKRRGIFGVIEESCHDNMDLLPIHKFPATYHGTYPLILSSSSSSLLPFLSPLSNLHSFHSHINWTICCGKKNAPIKYGFGDQKLRFRS